MDATTLAPSRMTAKASARDAVVLLIATRHLFYLFEPTAAIGAHFLLLTAQARIQFVGQIVDRGIHADRVSAVTGDGGSTRRSEEVDVDPIRAVLLRESHVRLGDAQRILVDPIG